MLVELTVENYAVVERIRVRFDRGLNLLTGETGSGKSIVVDALGLLWGARASPDMVRAGAEKARISGLFEVAPAVSKHLEAAGMETEDHELLVEREILANGKSRAFVGNRPATVALLRELAPHLGDIHGQHDQQQLFSQGSQRDMLDAFASAEGSLAEVAEAFQGWRAATAELEELDRSSQEALRLADLWTFQRNEIETAAPLAGEDERLEIERRVLRNAVRLGELAGEAYATLYDAPESVSAQLRVVTRRLEDGARIDPGLSSVVEALQPAAVAADEAAHALRAYLGKLESDPGRLDEVDARLAALEKLKRKYGGNLAEVLTFLDNIRRELCAVETSSERREALRHQIEAYSTRYTDAASRLSARRTEAARQLSRRVETELASLAMEKTRLDIRIQSAAWSEAGYDAVSILISPNPGEEPKPLDTIASGGELSRIALALKTCSAPGRPPSTSAPPRTLVFDEVDAGVGGSAAEAVGRRLKKLAGSHQVLCVTHWPQIAGFADHHYYVAKHASKGRTWVAIERLSPEERTREIGRMLSGERVTREALQHAEQLLKAAAK